MPGQVVEPWSQWPLAASGRPLLLVPDAHRCAGGWPDTLCDGLGAAGWSVGLVDLRDQGRSRQPAGTYGFDELVDDVAAALDCGPDRPAWLLGHGMGGTLALRLALDRPERVAGLVLVGSTGWFADPTLPGPSEPTAVGLIWRARLGVAGEGDAIVRALGRELRLLVGSADDPGPVAARQEVARWLAWGYNPLDGHRRAWLAAPPLWDRLAAVRVPTLVVHGAADPLLPPEHGRRLAASLPVAQLVEVPGAGHALTEPLVEAVLSHLPAVSQGPAAG